MPQEQPRTYSEKFNELLLEMQRSAVTKEEVKAVIDTFISHCNKLLKQVDGNKAAMKAETERLGREVAEFEKRIRGYVDEKTAESAGELEKHVNELRVYAEYVESLIEKYDDTELRTLVETVQGQIPQLPEQFNPSSLVVELTTLKNQLAVLEDRITNLPATRGGGGGVTNMRIIQAFKYILKTEEPDGDIDGVNATFTLSQPVFAVLSMSLNGETIAQLPNYTVSDRTITFASPLPAAYSGKDFEVKYI